MSFDIKKLAKGKQCYLRLNGCSGDSSTVVLAHIRRGGIAGVGQKPLDIAAIPMDFYCHERYDGRVKCDTSRTDMDADALRGLCQWLSYLMANGYIHIGAPK